ncbi:hypothetical protein [Nocardia donostiensis]|uniref:hypothetical protein n=1 Tax=Nocardia donostiensis TaxID=1538463 RepID=UPI0020CA3E4E|nr:hypothetical protein [Nocardia donostiensis]
MTTDESGPAGRRQNSSETGYAEQADATVARASKVHRVRIDIERILDNHAVRRFRCSCSRGAAVIAQGG